MAKVITISGLEQVDELPKGDECTPVEGRMMSGKRIVRCKEDIMEEAKNAPEKMGEIAVATKKPRRGAPGHLLGATDKACVPEWVSLRTKLGKTVKRCHCKHGRFMPSAACSRGE